MVEHYVDEMEARLDLDHRAFDARYTELLADLRRVCQGLGAGPDAEDLAQDVLLYGRAHLDELRDDAKLRPWLRRIAVRWALRPNRRQGSPSVAVESWHGIADLDLRLDERAALGDLSPRQRQLVSLVYLAGFRQEEAAEMLGISRGTVARTLWDARCALAVKLGDYGSERR